MKQFNAFLKIFKSKIKRDEMKQDDTPTTFLKTIIIYLI